MVLSCSTCSKIVTTVLQNANFWFFKTFLNDNINNIKFQYNCRNKLMSHRAWGKCGEIKDCLIKRLVLEDSKTYTRRWLQPRFSINLHWQWAASSTIQAKDCLLIDHKINPRGLKLRKNNTEDVQKTMKKKVSTVTEPRRCMGEGNYPLIWK